MNDSEIDRLLRATSERVTLPDSFRHDVWRRIENAEMERSRVPSWLQECADLLIRPWAGAVGVAAAAALGLALGAFAPFDRQDDRSSYIRSISPFESHNL